MANEATKTGKELERRVAQVYRQVGARRVEHDVNLAGNQIDVYVELETPSHFLHRVAIEAKDWDAPVGIDVVNRFATVVNLLHHERLIDEGVVISTAGFTRPARDAAQTYGIQLLESADVEAMARQVREAEARNAEGLIRALRAMPESELRHVLESIDDLAVTRMRERHVPVGEDGWESIMRLRQDGSKCYSHWPGPDSLSEKLDRMARLAAMLAHLGDCVPDLVRLGRELRPGINWPAVVSH